MELKTRRVVHSAITKSPTDEWTAQQLREATPWGKGPKYLIHDRDSKYASHFSAVVAGSGIKELKTPFRAPRAKDYDSYCTLFVLSSNISASANWLRLDRLRP